jgi:Xaa-Pro aminopeptidase
MNEMKSIMDPRVANLRSKMAKYKVDILFCTSLRSLSYVADIYQSLTWYVKTAVVLPASGDLFLSVPLSDRARVEKETWIKDIRTWNPEFTGIEERKFEDIITEFVRENRLEKGTLGIEGNLSWPLQKFLADSFPEARLFTIDDLMEECMMIKDDHEIGLMRKAASVCVVGYEAARDNVKPGMTENELAGYMEIAMRRAGCTGYWVPNQVGTGETVLLDHYPSDAVISENHYVKVGVHGTYRLYHGDICNVMALGKPDPDYIRLCSACEEASKRTIDAMRPGALSCDLFAVFYNTMAQKGYAGACNWYLGHGLGTGHQKPLISPHDRTEIKERMIIILNALAQPEGKNGFINEVMLLITADGPELISHNPLGLVQL